jgi:hypothetical protein
VICNPTKVAPMTCEIFPGPPARNIGLTASKRPRAFLSSLAANAMLSKKSGERSSPNDRHNKSPTARAWRALPRLFTTNELSDVSYPLLMRHR